MRTVLSFLPAIEGVQVDGRVAAFALTASLVTAVLFAGSDDPIGKRLLMAIPLGLIGGFVAPVARDLVATWTKR